MRIERVESLHEGGRSFVVRLDTARRLDVDMCPEDEGWRVEIVVPGHPVQRLALGRTAEDAYRIAVRDFRLDLPWDAIRRELAKVGAFAP
jgi:hypothetical protein